MSKDFPEVNEIVLGTVLKTRVTSVFVKLQDYNHEGVIIFSEVAPGRIRNIRDYVKQGQKIAVKVIRVNKEKGHIDLSLRRVSQKEKKQALESEKKERELKFILELVIKDKTKQKEVFENIKEEGIFDFFEKAVKKEESSLKFLKKIKLTDKQAKDLIKKIQEKIKTKKIFVRSKINVTCFEENGLDKIKKTLDISGVKINYISAPKYVLEVEDSNYKSANKKMESFIEQVESNAKKNKCILEVIRKK